MSSASTATSAAGAAPWRTLFLSHLAQMDSPEFVFSTLSSADSKGSQTPFLPRARYCIFRGMWGELPPNERNAAPKNEPVYESDLPTLTTDARMQKIQEVFGSSPNYGGGGQSQGSGGGGPVEAVFWAKPAMTQWRVRGEAYIVGPDIEGPGEDSSEARAVKGEVGKRMRAVKAGKDSWSWAKEVTAHFGNLSPVMRGSFKNPAPGTPISIPPSDERLGLGQKVSDLHDEVARKNFRVVIIKPEEVEQIDLTNPERVRRWKFTYVTANDGCLNLPGEDDVGAWKSEELWP